MKFWKFQFDVSNLHFWIYISYLPLGYLPFQFVFFDLLSMICEFNFLMCEFFDLCEVFNFFEFKLVLNFVASKLFICETFSL